MVAMKRKNERSGDIGRQFVVRHAISKPQQLLCAANFEGDKLERPGNDD
jgi:hypothetical protein